MAAFMRRHITSLLLALALLAGSAPARAQFFSPDQQQPQPPPRPQLRPPVQAPAPPPAVSDAAAPFDADLQRLAEILGTLHYLRNICGTNEGQKWRGEMQALVDAETPSGDRRTRMIASFNRGYNGFQQTYRTCTPAATVAIKRYLDEGSKISRDLTARYAN
jgi:uncharacterized protein (TIGR02301 family)